MHKFLFPLQLQWRHDAWNVSSLVANSWQIPRKCVKEMNSAIQYYDNYDCYVNYTAQKLSKGTKYAKWPILTQQKSAGQKLTWTLSFSDNTTPNMQCLYYSTNHNKETVTSKSLSHLLFPNSQPALPFQPRWKNGIASSNNAWKDEWHMDVAACK